MIINCVFLLYFPDPRVPRMMSVIVIFAFSVLLPTSIVAGMNIPHVTNSSHPNFHPLKLSHSQKLNSSHSREFSRTGIVKREIGDESEDALHPYYTVRDSLECFCENDPLIYLS